MCCGVSIRATGNIQVDGVIEACIIEAGKNIVVSSGIQGQKNAVIKAHKSVYAKYLENCTVYAKEDVYADCIIGCSIFSNGSVKAITGMGAIIGGIIRSSKGVMANSVVLKPKNNISAFRGLPCDDCEKNEIIEELKKLICKFKGLKKSLTQCRTRTEISKLRLKTYASRMKLELIDKEVRAVLKAQAAKDKRCLICNSAYPARLCQLITRNFVYIVLSRTAQ